MVVRKHISIEYEKEHNIRTWNLKTFHEAFSALDSKIGRLSEWKTVDENPICYSVKKCNLVQIGVRYASASIPLCHRLFS